MTGKKIEFKPKPRRAARTPEEWITAGDEPESDPAQEQPRGRGRPKGSAGGKRDDAEYTQAGAYIRKDVHKKVKAALILEDKEFSELVEELLVEWLKARG